MKVFVYYNLHKKLWSVKALEGPDKGKVIAHEKFVYMVNCEFKVSEAGRQRVLKEKRKNVHAGVVGYLIDFDELDNMGLSCFGEATYNPYFYESFVRLSSLDKATPLYSSKACEMFACPGESPKLHVY